MGKFLSPDVFSKLSQQLKIDFRLRRPPEGSTTAIIKNDPAESRWRPLSLGKAQAFRKIGDLASSNATWIEVTVPRDVYKRGLNTSIFSGIVLLVIGIIFSYLWVKLSYKKSKLQEMRLQLVEQEKDILKGKNKYRVLLNNQNDAIFSHEVLSEGFAPFSEVNEKAVTQYGYSREEFSKLTAEDLTRMDDSLKYQQPLVREQLLTEGHATFEATHVKKSGEQFPVEVNASLVELDGRTYILSTVRDISERQQAEQKSKAYQQQLITILNSIDANVYVADMETYEILFMNKNMIQDFGQDLTGKTCWEVFRGESAPCGECPNHLLVNAGGQPAGGYAWSSQNPINGKYYINHDRAIEWTDGCLAHLQIATDISDIKSMEKQLSLKHKMEAVGYMAGGMAHNFNNNLSIILGNIELTQLRQPADSEVIPFLENAKIAVRRSRDLVQKIITYSRKGMTRKASMQLPDIIDETLNLLSSTLPTTVSLSKNIAPESDANLINADASQIQEVLINLCNNAVQAMDEKGELTISLQPVELETKDISVQYECLPGRYAKLSVQDSGCGIPAEMLDKIFDPFFSTKEEHEGAGMGLSTVQGIVVQHGGVIEVNSAINQGTTFDLYFPIIEKTDVVESVDENIALPRGTERILFVDDDVSLARLGETLLSEIGYQVSMMTDSNEALKMFTANADSFDLVITDQTMPNLTGKELIEELKKVRPKIPTILCTGYSSRVDEAEAIKSGISAFMMKPLDLPMLAQKIRQVLDGREDE